MKTCAASTALPSRKATPSDGSRAADPRWPDSLVGLGIAAINAVAAREVFDRRVRNTGGGRVKRHTATAIRLDTVPLLTTRFLFLFFRRAMGFALPLWENRLTGSELMTPV